MVILVLAGCAGDPDLEELKMPEFGNLSAQASKNSLYLECTYKGKGVAMCGFALTRAGEIVKKQEASTRNDGVFSLTVNGLEYDTEYTYYAWISNGSTEIHSNTGTVRTEQNKVVRPDILGVSFEADENVLTMRCNYAGEGVDGCGFYFNGSDKMAADVRGDGEFSLTLRNLEYDKEYDYQAYITSGQTEIKSDPVKARTGKMASVPMSDAAFKAYILSLYDTDKNGKLGMEEAEKITRLDINTYDLKIKSLEGIEYFINLEYLKAVGYDDSRRGELTRLDLSKNKKLATLYCSFNKLDFLDLGNSSALKYVDCSSNYLLNVNLPDHRPDFSQLTGLEYLDCHSNDGLLVWLGYNTALKYLDCSYTVGYDYVGYCTAIEYIDCSYCSYMTNGTILSGLTKLTTFKCNYTDIPSIEAEGCTALAELECWQNMLEELDVSSSKKLNLRAWPQKSTFSKLWIGSGEYHYFNSSGAEVNPADYGTEVIVKE